MKLNEIKIYITRIEEYVDKNGITCLKCKGYNAINKTQKNWFSQIRLYPISQEQFDETKERLFSQKCSSPKLRIVCYDNELYTPVFNGGVRVMLTVNKYDFVENKLYKKSKLLKGEV